MSVVLNGKIQQSSVTSTNDAAGVFLARFSIPKKNFGVHPIHLAQKPNSTEKMRTWGFTYIELDHGEDLSGSILETHVHDPDCVVETLNIVINDVEKKGFNLSKQLNGSGATVLFFGFIFKLKNSYFRFIPRLASLF